MIKRVVHVVLSSGSSEGKNSVKVLSISRDRKKITHLSFGSELNVPVHFKNNTCLKDWEDQES